MIRLLFLILFLLIIILPLIYALIIFYSLIKYLSTPARRKPVPRWKIEMGVYKKGDNLTNYKDGKTGIFKVDQP